MITQPIVESGMIFGPYPEGDFFYIEKSQIYQEIRDGVKIAEFLLLYRETNEGQPTILIIEAKSSSPKPEKEKEVNFEKYISDIREKFLNTLLLFAAIHLHRHQSFSEYPEKFQKLDLQKTNIRFILIIKGHKDNWLPPLQEALTKALKPIVKVWNLPPSSVAVFNDTLAQKKGIIQVCE